MNIEKAIRENLAVYEALMGNYSEPVQTQKKKLREADESAYEVLAERLWEQGDLPQSESDGENTLSGGLWKEAETRASGINPPQEPLETRMLLLREPQQPEAMIFPEAAREFPEPSGPDLVEELVHRLDREARLGPQAMREGTML